MPSIIALAADLIFGSRIRGAGEAAGTPVVLARSADDLLRRAVELMPRMVLLDLDARGVDAPAVIRALRESVPDARIVAYVSHVNADAIAGARAAGAHRVLARSAFVRELPELLRGS